MKVQSSSSIAPLRSLAKPGRRFSGLLSVLDLVRQRKHLSNLDERQLNDIGISPQEASLEAKRAFWDVPQTWIK